jgi:hypothetical protein
MNALWISGAIPGEGLKQFKYDQSKIELEGMFQKGSISKWDFQCILGDLTFCKCADALITQHMSGTISAEYCRQLKHALDTLELEGSLKKGFKAVKAFQTPQADVTQHTFAGEVMIMPNTGAVSAEDLRHLTYDLLKFGLEGMLKKGVISEIDFETLEGDVAQRPHIRDLKTMRPSGAIREEDFKHLKRLYDLIKFGLQGMLNKGAISDAGFHTLEVYSAHCQRIQDLNTMRGSGAISAEHFQDLKNDLIKAEVEIMLEEASISKQDSTHLQHDLSWSNMQSLMVGA